MEKTDPTIEAVEAARVRNSLSYMPTLAGGLIDQALADRAAMQERAHDYDKDSPEEQEAERTQEIVAAALKEGAVSPQKNQTKSFRTHKSHTSFAKKMDAEIAAADKKQESVAGADFDLAKTDRSRESVFVATSAPKSKTAAHLREIQPHAAPRLIR